MLCGVNVAHNEIRASSVGTQIRRGGREVLHALLDDALRLPHLEGVISVARIVGYADRTVRHGLESSSPYAVLLSS